MSDQGAEITPAGTQIAKPGVTERMLDGCSTWTTRYRRTRLGAVGIVLTVAFLVNAPLQIFDTARWTDTVGTIVFLALLAWVFVLGIVLVVSPRRDAPEAAGGTW